MTTERIFLLNPIPDQFRWLAIVEDGRDWGVRVARVRDTPVGNSFGPIPVEWTPETISRPLPDFPNFRTNMLAVSYRAKSLLETFFMSRGEWVALTELDEAYSAFHCLQVADCLDRGKTTERLSASIYKSFHSSRFVPALQGNGLPHAHVFRISESISKLFVSEEFKMTYEQHNLSGLEFFEVEVMS